MVSLSTFTNPLIITGVVVFLVILIILGIVLSKNRRPKERRPLNEIFVMFLIGLFTLNLVIGPLTKPLGLDVQTPGTKVTIILGLILLAMGIVAKILGKSLDTTEILIMVVALGAIVATIILIDDILPQSLLDIKPFLANTMSTLGSVFQGG